MCVCVGVMYTLIVTIMVIPMCTKLSNLPRLNHDVYLPLSPPQLPSLTSSTPPHLPSLTNGPIVNGSDMTAQSSSGSPTFPTFPRQSLDDEAQPEEETK